MVCHRAVVLDGETFVVPRIVGKERYLLPHLLFGLLLLLVLCRRFLVFDPEVALASL
jgi:hypothetical protein